MKTPAEIVEAFAQSGWKNNDPMGQVLALRREDPVALADLVLRFLDSGLTHTTFIDVAMDLMDDASHADAVRRIWQRFLGGQNGSGSGRLLESAAIQWPHVFAGHWEHLLSASHAATGLHVDNAWRAMDEATALEWLGLVEAGADDRDRAMALLHTRRPDVVHAAWRKVFAGQPDMDEIAWMDTLGYALKDGNLRPLHGDRPLHISFGKTQRRLMDASRPAWSREIHRLHPTWQPAITTDPPFAANMGGALASACGLCHDALHCLLALPDPRRAGITSDTPLVFGVCLSCLGWEGNPAMYYRHDAAGTPQAHPSQQNADPVTPEFPASPLLEAEVELFEAPARWTWQDWGESNGRQNLSRIGGAPSWVQSAWYPPCPDCGDCMDFVMQLDSNLPQEDGGEWLWGSGGCNYTFWCAHCRVSAHFWQCT